MTAERRDWRDVVADLGRCAREQAELNAVQDEATTVADGPAIMAEAAELLWILGPSMDGGNVDRSHLDWATQADLIEYLRGCASRIEYECEKVKTQAAQRRYQLAVNIRAEVSRIRFAINYADPDVPL